MEFRRVLFRSLYVYDVKTNQTSKIDYTAPSHYSLNKKESFKTERISYFDVSPDKEKIAFISRGVLFVADKEGKFVTEIVNNGERVMERSEERRVGKEERARC